MLLLRILAVPKVIIFNAPDVPDLRVISWVAHDYLGFGPIKGAVQDGLNCISRNNLVDQVIPH